MRARLLLPLLLAGALACPDMCTGHGTCDGRYCTCDATWKGSDCSLRACPYGTAWADGATSHNTAHNPAECSGRGHCDEAIGECQCADGYEGSACERSVCPGTPTCSGHGQCFSLADAAATQNDVSLLTTGSYTDWDADMGFGCACDAGWHGYNCSLRFCEKGDDPMTTGQADEVQEVDCTCAGCDSTSSFTLKFRGEATAEIYWDDPEALVEYKLEALPTVDDVSVSFAGGTTVCDNDGVQTSVTFLTEHGDLPDMIVASASGDSVQPTASVSETTPGTKEWLECSDRGECDWVYGNCTCFAGFSGSDGQGNAGDRDDCGDGTTAACPTHDSTECNGHGTCLGAGGDYKCDCDPGWDGPSCAKNLCPGDVAWWDEAGHPEATECSGGGVCEWNSGVCYCDERYDGTGCEMHKCYSDTVTAECSGHGSCHTMREFAPLYRSKGVLANFTYTAPWDQNKTQLCLCDAPETFVYNTKSTTYTGPAAWGDTAYAGYNCSLKLCPHGDDPLTPGADEVQSQTCYGDAGEFFISYKGYTSRGILTTATEADLVEELELIQSIAKVEVSFQNGRSAVCDPEGTVTLITFTQDFTDIPLLNATWTQDVEPLTVGNTGAYGNVTYEEVTACTKENVECSNHGICDRVAGSCNCDAGWMGSDGHGGKGQRGDCGHKVAQNGAEALEDYYKRNDRTVHVG